MLEPTTANIGSNKLAKTVGISSAVITILFVAGLAISAYKSYFEIKEIKLNIKKLEQDLGE